MWWLSEPDMMCAIRGNADHLAVPPDDERSELFKGER
jgi:hypothetical protein